jgi:hypothetical protein
MSLETEVKDVINQKLNDGTIEKIISEQLEKGVSNAMENLFRSYGDVTKIIEEKIKSVMVPYLEGYDYSEYITKLDSVLVDVLKHAALDNKVMLENFKELMMPVENDTIKASELFDRWTKYVAKNVETDGLEIDYDDEPTYECVEVSMEFEENSERSWSSFSHAVITLECDHDENMNFQFRISRYKESRDETWDIHFDRTPDIKSLRRLNDFEILLMRLEQGHIKLDLDTTHETDEIRPEKEPEISFS